MSVTHAGLVAIAARWLQKKCAVVITEIATTGEEPDAIGWQGSHSTLVECKISMADFYADRRKDFRLEAARGIGCHRYFLAPAGVLTLEQMPEKWGLLEWDGEKIKTVQKSEYFEPANARHEIRILLSTLRRIGRSPLAGTSIRYYTFTTKNRATLGTIDESP